MNGRRAFLVGVLVIATTLLFATPALARTSAFTRASRSRSDRHCRTGGPCPRRPGPLRGEPDDHYRPADAPRRRAAQDVRRAERSGERDGLRRGSRQPHVHGHLRPRRRGHRGPGDENRGLHGPLVRRLRSLARQCRAFAGRRRRGRPERAVRDQRLRSAGSRLRLEQRARQRRTGLLHRRLAGGERTGDRQHGARQRR